MRAKHFWNVLILAAAVALLGGCADGDIDDADSAPVELQVDVTQSPAIRGQLEGTECLLTVTEWTVTYKNQPKSELAKTSPFNDIYVDSVTVSYEWPASPGVVPPPPRTIPTPGTVAPEQTKAIPFVPILLDDVSAEMLGTTAILTLDVNARTAAGDPIEIRAGEALVIEACRGGG